MNKSIKYVTALLAICLVACDENETSVSSAALDETTFAENVLAESSENVDDALTARRGPRGIWGGGSIGAFGSYSNCAAISEETQEGVDYPVVITIDYADSCSSRNGNLTKSGKIIVTLTGDATEVGSQRIVVYDNYVVNDHLIEGTRTFTYNGGKSHSITLVGGKITTPEGLVITRESSKTKTLVSGADTEDREDDVYEITGSVSGVNAEGESYSKSITSPLVKSRDCPWVTSGIIEKTCGDDVVVVDFGDGTCDNLATRTENGVAEDIEMDYEVKRRVKKRHS